MYETCHVVTVCPEMLAMMHIFVIAESKKIKLVYLYHCGQRLFFCHTQHFCSKLVRYKEKFSKVWKFEEERVCEVFCTALPKQLVLTVILKLKQTNYELLSPAVPSFTV